MSADSQYMGYGDGSQTSRPGQAKQSSPVYESMIERYIMCISTRRRHFTPYELLFREAETSHAKYATHDMDPTRFVQWMRSMLSGGERSGSSGNAIRRAIFSVDMTNFASFLKDEYEDVPACSVLAVTSPAVSTLMRSQMSLSFALRHVTMVTQWGSSARLAVSIPEPSSETLTPQWLDQRHHLDNGRSARDTGDYSKHSSTARMDDDGIQKTKLQETVTLRGGSYVFWGNF
ncbi:hypothetical protein QQS21_000875 [Conoideocrella luteorostrata]|uniref:Uncharacterized protein n=1 Tax=Conoideocrella luteorostrata TaxID=1105319 RepID=A0AAJ0CZ54_9HYPO|nr:hypothetical protein QQS21_000875 [Conoideocrella luteorostrata]